MIKYLSNKVIEQQARDLQVEMWENAGCPKGTANILKVFEPEIIAKYLKYDYQMPDNLGEVRFNKNKFETAGIVDHSRKVIAVSLSSSFKQTERKFTAAHEIGHIILHPNLAGLHRDRPMGDLTTNYDPIEFQANKFASYLLMPERLVLDLLEARFGAVPIIFDEKLSFNLDMNNPNGLLRIEESSLEREVALASYNGRNNFLSLAELFGVSIKAMAIRLKELGVVRYP